MPIINNIININKKVKLFNIFFALNMDSEKKVRKLSQL